MLGAALLAFLGVGVAGAFLPLLIFGVIVFVVSKIFYRCIVLLCYPLTAIFLFCILLGVCSNG
jgi:hypothetical protein